MKKDLGISSIISFLCILILLIGSFGTWKNPLFSVLALMSALIWTVGVLALSIHTLNMISSMFGIMLIGLGIDFGIHYITGFIGAREDGLTTSESISSMYRKVGNGVLIGALSTAFVFLSLSFNKFKAMREMGIACGIGIMICYIVMSVMLPAILAWDNKGYTVTGNVLRRIHLGFLPKIWNRIINLLFAPFRLSFLNPFRKFLSFSFLSVIGKLMENTSVAITVLILTMVSVYFSIVSIKHIDFEYNIMKLEAEGIPSAVYQEKIMEAFEFFPEHAVITASTLDECRQKIKQLKKVADKTGLIGRIDGLTEFLPEKEVQQNNKKILNIFKDSLNSKKYIDSISAQELENISKELKRLHNNIVEIGELSVASDGEGNKVVTVCDEITGLADSNSVLLGLKRKIAEIDNCGEKLERYQKILIPTVKRLLIRKASADIVSAENIPENIKNRYVNSVNGDLLITIYPKEQVYDENNMNRFIEATENISEKVTGNLIMMNLFLSLIKEKGKVAIVIAGITVILLLLLDLKSVKHTFFALTPLVTGFLWIFGLMALFQVKFNISNFMMLPLILGIGIDDGVHMLHRYRIEGKNSLPEVLRHTGRAILLTTLTTLIAFGSLTTMSRRGPASAALVLCFGVAACFISSVFVLPALITIWGKMFPGKGKR
jgi:predicted RND superfamily exporter protein